MIIVHIYGAGMEVPRGREGDTKVAMPKKIKTSMDVAFPAGLFALAAAEVVRAKDYSGRQPVDAVDAETGLPVWQLDVIDGDSDARKQAAFTLKIVSAVQPVLPEVTPGPFPVRVLELEGLTATPYVADSPMGGGKGRLAWSFRCTGIATAPSAAQPARPASKKEAA